MKKSKWLIHNSFYVRNQRKENLSSLYGLPQNLDMDMYDYEFDEKGQLAKIHSKLTGRTVILGSVFPTKEIADECCRH